MECRYFEAEDYDNIVKWWNFWRFPAPSLEMLSSIGIIVSLDGVDIVCGWLYTTNSAMAHVEFIVSNPEVRDRDVRAAAIIGLINELCISAKELGYKYAYTTLVNKNLQNKFKDYGFLEGSVNCTEYVKIL
jgi:hypothetical protein